MRRNVYNVMTDAFKYMGVSEHMFHIEFGPIEEVGVLLITYSVNMFQGLVTPLNQCLIKISYVDGEEDPTLFLVGNDLFKHPRMERLMEYIANHPIDLGDA